MLLRGYSDIGCRRGIGLGLVVNGAFTEGKILSVEAGICLMRMDFAT
jgi:hypothetical protein